MAAKCLLVNYSCVINCYIWTTVMFWVSFFFSSSPSPPSIILERSRNKQELAASGRRCGRRCSLGFSGECSRFPTSTDRLLIWREPVLLLWCGTLCREGDTCRRAPFDPAGKGRKLECWGKSSGAGATAARPSGRLSRVSFSAVSVGIIISL